MEQKTQAPRQAGMSPYLIRAAKLMEEAGYDSKEIIRRLSLGSNSRIVFSSYPSPDGRKVKVEMSLGNSGGGNNKFQKKLVLENGTLRQRLSGFNMEVSTQIDKREEFNAVFQLPNLDEPAFRAGDGKALETASLNPGAEKTVNDSISKENNEGCNPFSLPKIGKEPGAEKMLREGTD